MTSEELEQSLRTEFENYLKDTVSEMKEDVSAFQEKVEAAFERHRSEIDAAFQEFFEKFGADRELEVGFSESVAEHLKLARDEGSKITAAAFAEAEKLSDESEEDDEAAAAPVPFADMRDAITEISGKDSQSDILMSLVDHASRYTPRGAFFIVKNEHLVGWRLFGTEEHPDPDVVRDVFFPISSETALTEAVRTLATVEGSGNVSEDNSLYLEKLGFADPDRMYAIPLVVRGRGVAVLYADNGDDEGSVNVEALETMMRVAGLTVEVLASAQMARTQTDEEMAYAEAPAREEEAEEVYEEEYAAPEEEYADEYAAPEEEHAEEAAPAEEEYAGEEYVEPEFGMTEETEETEEVSAVEEEAVEEEPSPTGFDFQPAEEETSDYDFRDETSDYEPVADAEVTEEYSFEEVEADQEAAEEEVAYDDSSWEQPAEETGFSEAAEEEEEVEYSTAYDPYEADVEEEETVSAVDDYEAVMEESQEQPEAFEAGDFDSETFVEEVETASEEEEEDSYEMAEPAEEDEFDSMSDLEEEPAPAEESVSRPVEEAVPEPAVAAPPVRARFADRNVDLPIEVSEDERRLHNDARRFARLLVSEIKLYNEQKVKEGRESSDLYERLREAIDRSREMYDKRVQPPVAAKFDYFNYELVNTLAEGDADKLGTSYPGGSV